MTRNEYIDLFHKAQVNLVAFKQVFQCDEELRKMVEMAVAAEREACAQLCDDWAKNSYLAKAKSCARIIRARGNK